MMSTAAVTPVWMRLVGALLAAVTGAFFAAAGTAMHRVVWSVGPVPIPVGLLLGITAVLACAIAFRRLFEDRLPLWAYAAGAILTVVLLGQVGPGGSVLILDGSSHGLPLGLLWTFAPAIAVIIVTVWPRLPARGPVRTQPEHVRGA